MDADAANLASSEDASMDRRQLRRLQDQLLMLMLIDSLPRKAPGVDGEDDLQDISLSDQSAISKELLLTMQRLLDAQLLRLKHQDLRTMPSYSSASVASASVQQLMENKEAAAETNSKAAAKKKKRNRKNKSAAKQKSKLMSWSGAGIIMMALSSITTLLVTLSLVHHSDGLRGRNALPAWQPSTHNSLRHRSQKEQSSNAASTYDDGTIISGPKETVVKSPVFSPTAISVRDRHLQSDEDGLSECFDTPNWKDKNGLGCDWYERIDEPGCSRFGNSHEGDMGVANEHCCHCGGGSHTLPPTTSPWPSLSPSIAASPTEFCLDTPNWEDIDGYGCDWYKEEDVPGCPFSGYLYGEDMGVANEHCCYCGGGSRNCEELRSKCQKYFSVLGINDGVVAPEGVCEEAESCSCEGEDHEVKLVNFNGKIYTVGLYNECKCEFWSRLCDDTEEGIACDYAAEYCCGDYSYNEEFGEGEGHLWYLNSPTCYCDFFNYAQNEFGHTSEPKTLNVTGAVDLVLSNPCDQFDQFWVGILDPLVDPSLLTELEKLNLEAIYNETNGQNWTNNTGWMNDTIPHCQWYGVSCEDRRFVTGIDLRDNNLEGQFPVYTRNETSTFLQSDWQHTKYGLANLYSLKTLDLADNMFTGTIDYRPLYNLNSLTHFDVSGNQFLSGEMDVLITPSIIYVGLSNNNFESLVSFKRFKKSFQTLRYCDVSNNAIQIDETDLFKNIPSNIEEFIASNNRMYGNLPASLNNLPKLRRFDMSFNSLSGKLSTFDDSFLTFQKLDLSNQEHGLVGVIPEELWRLQFLKTLNLAGNKLTGTLSIDIANMVVLERFDVSHNLLSGQIPSQIGQLQGTLNYLGLANNAFSGTIPAQLGRLEGASVFVKGDYFDTNANTPLSLCTLSRVEASDVATDTSFCPIERNALAKFYDAAKGVEWTNGTDWIDEYKSPCDGWYGVTCVNDRVTELDLRNNGLSGRLSESIVELALLERLDLSDNDIKGPIPTEIGELSELTYLRLSSNAFTGTAPQGLANLKHLQLLQLQSNRISNTSFISDLVLDKTIYNVSTFVTDCGVPSAFEEAPECEHCTMCCNANEDCHPQEKTDYGATAAVLIPCFAILCCVIFLILYHFHSSISRWCSRVRDYIFSCWCCLFVLFLYRFRKDKDRLGNDDRYALSKIGKDSVYSYFVTTKFYGWVIAIATLCAQTGILFFFVIASEVNLGDDKTDIEFTWKCPLDSERCKDKSDLEKAGWAIFWILMITFLAKDMVNGIKLIYHSSQIGQPFWRWSRIRYFVSGLSLCLITLFALYVSTVYNSAIATSNTEIILNAVVVLFVMEMDEYIFATLEAINDKWTAHADDSELEDKIESQQKELMRQKNQIEMLSEALQRMQETQAAAAAKFPWQQPFLHPN